MASSIPKPSITRPPLSSSNEAVVAAIAPGWRSTGEVMPGSRITPSSAIQTSSRPARSATTTASTSGSTDASG
jgi:hypothetical protein